MNKYLKFSEDCWCKGSKHQKSCNWCHGTGIAYRKEKLMKAIGGPLDCKWIGAREASSNNYSQYNNAGNGDLKSVYLYDEMVKL